MREESLVKEKDVLEETLKERQASLREALVVLDKFTAVNKAFRIKNHIDQVIFKKYNVHPSSYHGGDMEGNIILI